LAAAGRVGTSVGIPAGTDGVPDGVADEVADVLVWLGGAVFGVPALGLVAVQAVVRAAVVRQVRRKLVCLLRLVTGVTSP
jgi:hypothetical protein